jgi:hypothetical protein
LNHQDTKAQRKISLVSLSLGGSVSIMGGRDGRKFE